MRKRVIAGGIAAAALTLWAARFWLKTAQELRRYDHIRSLSNEGPFTEEAPDVVMQALQRQGETVKEWLSFLQSAPKDAARYLKIEAM
jgi:hypothetical protein